ncbi:MAG: hypothetical protein M3Y59_04265 [Myxococcota bacterium]|nr:hypothetical protein [Myxococcota bacterium]
MIPLALALVLSGISVSDQLDGTEIGDEKQYIAFNSGGVYLAERDDGGKGGKTSAKGTWAISGDKLEVKIASCKGPRCGELGKSYSAQVQIVAERALTISSSLQNGPLSSGSYYCRFQGCEKRTGVSVVSHGAKANVMKYLVDYLVDQNRTRDVTVVWWGKKQPAAAAQSSITWCNREPKRAKEAAEQAAKDLGELSWFGKVTPVASTDSACLHDVQIVVGDAVKIPPRR